VEDTFGGFGIRGFHLLIAVTFDVSLRTLAGPRPMPEEKKVVPHPNSIRASDEETKEA
jgi:hypothetical protein